MPPASGRPFSIAISMPAPGTPRRAEVAAMADVLRAASVGMRASDTEVTRTPGMGDRRAVTVSRAR
jgi:hypothetical protein